MPESPAAMLVDRLRRIARPGEPDPDAQLLARFAATRDPAAFEQIVRRHGPMVLGVCRRVTGHQADADDAFQAAFLVLVHKARTVTGPLLGPWLSGVAYRTAMKARSTTARRRARESPLPDDVCAAPADDRDDLAGRLDREIQSLPDRYRVPVVLCELQGLSYREAAVRLGVKEGTLAGRLTRGRRLLADRLRRRGLVVAAGPLTAVVPRSVSAVVPAELVRSTVAAASGRVSPTVAALTHGVLTNMLLSKLLPATAVMALVAALALTTTTDRGHAAPVKGTADKPPAAGTDDPKKIDEALADPNLYHPRVWLELKLSAEQRDEIDRLLDAEETGQIELLKEMLAGNLARNQRGAEAAVRARNHMAKLPQETAVTIQTKVLKPDQARRLRQIALQAKGPSAFQRDDVKAALKYTAEQEKALSDQMDAAWDRIRTGTTETAGEAYTAAMTKLLDGLTKDQRKAWDDLTGKAFPMPDLVVRKMLNRQAIAAGGLPAAPAPAIGPLPPGGILLPPAGAVPPPAALPPPLPKR